MNYNLRIAEAAKSDIIEAEEWYNSQKPTLGDTFKSKVKEAFNYIEKNPKKTQLRYRNVHLYLIKRFPYGVHYYLDGSTIMVVALIHLNREPKSWLDRR